MTVEKAIEILSGFGIINRYCAEDAEVLDMAIKALERQTCEDCINRAEAIKETETLLRGNYDAEYIVETLKTLPPVTPKAEQKAILDKIKAEILDEAEYAYADFDRYKEDILCAEPDELPDDDFRYGLERAVEIINKYKAKKRG